MNEQEPVTAEQVARWWVQLNCWEWPSELVQPSPPNLTERDKEMIGRGAFTVVDAIVDHDLAMEFWQERIERDRTRATGVES